MSFRTARKLRLAGFSLRPTHQTCSLSTRELCSANSSEKANAARTDKAAKKNIFVKKSRIENHPNYTVKMCWAFQPKQMVRSRSSAVCLESQIG